MAKSTAKVKVKLDWNEKEMRKALMHMTREGFADAAEAVANETRKALDKIRSSSKWKSPGGYGWNKMKMAHGFIKSTVEIGSWEKDTAGGFLRLSSLYFPIRKGAMGKRGFGEDKGARSKAKPRRFVEQSLKAATPAILEAIRKAVAKNG